MYMPPIICDTCNATIEFNHGFGECVCAKWTITNTPKRHVEMPGQLSIPDLEPTSVINVL